GNCCDHYRRDPMCTQRIEQVCAAKFVPEIVIDQGDVGPKVEYLSGGLLLGRDHRTCRVETRQVKREAQAVSEQIVVVSDHDPRCLLSDSAIHSCSFGLLQHELL